MEDKKIIKLNDELLEKVAGGGYTGGPCKCANPIPYPCDGCYACRLCGRPLRNSAHCDDKSSGKNPYDNNPNDKITNYKKT